MNWWGWVLVGTILLAAELTFIDAQFYLLFVGASAVVVGLLAHAYPGVMVWQQWLLFGALSVVTVMTFRRAIYEKIRGEATVARETGPVGHELVLPAALAPGESCQVEFRGSHWTATNGASVALTAGARVQVEKVQGLALIVQPV